jgi:hypothetical protein
VLSAVEGLKVATPAFEHYVVPLTVIILIALFAVQSRGTAISRMKAIGADVVLIDPQFAPKVIAKPEIEDMVDLISSVAAQENVTSFPALLSCGTGTTSMVCHSRYSFHWTGCI